MHGKNPALLSPFVPLGLNVEVGIQFFWVPSDAGCEYGVTPMFYIILQVFCLAGSFLGFVRVEDN